MDDGQIGRVVRAVRHRKGWRQSDLASKSGHYRAALVELEAGRIGALRVVTLRDVAAALGLRLVIGFEERDVSLHGSSIRTMPSSRTPGSSAWSAGDGRCAPRSASITSATAVASTCSPGIQVRASWR